MAEQPQGAEAIFFAALELAGSKERAAYVEGACGSDAALLARVRELLDAHDETSGPLDAVPPGCDRPDTPLPDESAGTVLGPYKMLQQIGEGGMGTVWMAQQTEPVKRLVALKVIKPGMDSRQVIARFEAERQALALMDHPNIARVLDAGTTGAGRPYFVMELVKGVPLTKYCDEHRLTPRQRLELFIPVCQAIQHAHQKGIIHRDIKPSNVLVTSYDGTPVPKVIDFGIAKATGQQLTEMTLVTGFGNVVGTLEYMSPEQAELNALDIDTRSDVYALGVLLYELLTGSTPLEKKWLKEAAMLEVLRLIREEEPPRPSMRLSTTDELPAVAAKRGLEPKQLSGLVRGDLDWIVMKALEKDRKRRYETANGLAADVQRYLADEPVLACPPSAAYRVRKFARRHKVGLTVAAVVAVTLVVSAVVSSLEAFRAIQAEELASNRLTSEQQARVSEREAHNKLDADRAAKEQQRTNINRELSQKLAAATGLREKARAARSGDMAAWIEFRNVLRRAEALAAHELADELLVREVAAMAAELPQDEKDRRMTARLEEIRLRKMNAGWTGAMGYLTYKEAFQEYGLPVLDMKDEEAVRRIAASRMRDQLVAALDDWAQGSELIARLLPIAQRADDNPWRRQYYDARIHEDWAALRRLATDPKAQEQPPFTVCLLAGFLNNSSTAVQLLRQAQCRYPDDWWLNYQLAFTLRNRRGAAASLPEGARYGEEAISFMRVAAALRPRNTSLQSQLADYLSEAGRPAEAIEILRQLTRVDPKSSVHYVGLGKALIANRDLDGAIDVYRKAPNTDSWRYLIHRELGAALRLRGDWDLAAASYQTTIQLEPKDTEAYLGLGRALLHDKDQTGKPDVAACRKALELHPNAARAHAALGAALLLSRDLDGALAAYGKASELDPQDPEIHKALAEALRTRAFQSRDFAAYRKAADLVPKDSEFQRGLGDALHKRGDLDAAADAYRKAVAATEHAEYRSNLYYELASILRASGKWDEAVAACRKAVELKPKSPIAYMALGQALLHDKSAFPKDQVAAYLKAITLYPQSSTAHFGLGSALWLQHDTEGAVAAYRKALQLDPAFVLDARRLELVMTFLNFANALRDRGDWDEAVASYRKVIDVYPYRPEAYVGLGMALRHEKGTTSTNLFAAYWKARELYPQSAELHAAFGRALLYSREWAGAVAAFGKALECGASVERQQIQVQLAEALTGKRDWEGAIAVYRDLLKVRPNLVDAHTGLANVLKAKGDRDGAVAAYRKLSEILPDDAMAQQKAASGLSFLREWEAAIAIQRKLIDRHPDVPVYRSDLANTLFTKGDKEGAVAEYRKLIDLQPSNRNHHFFLADMLHSKGDLTGAVAELGKAIELAPDFTNAMLRRAEVYSELGEWNKAVKDYSRAMQIFPQTAVFVLNNRGVAYLNMGEPRKALADFSKALESQPMSANVFNNRGLAHMSLGEHEQALADFSKAIKLNKNSVMFLLNRGDLYRAIGEKDKALADHSRAIEVDGKSARAWFSRAIDYRVFGQPDKAVADFTQCLEVTPRYVEARYHRAAVYVQSRRFEEAMADYDKLLAMTQPGPGPLIYNEAAWLLADCPEIKFRDPTRAVKLARKAVEMAPQAGSFWNTLGVAHHRAGEEKEAVDALDKSVQLRKGGDAFDWLVLAQAHHKLGHADEARKYYDRAVQWLEKNADALAKVPQHAEELKRFRAEAEDILKLKKK